jgi:hypothetical protein
VEVVLEDLLDGAGSLGTGGTELVAVAVVDQPDVVRRRDHVRVDHHVDPVDLVLRELRGVVLRADERASLILWSSSPISRTARRRRASRTIVV